MLSINMSLSEDYQELWAWVDVSKLIPLEEDEEQWIWKSRTPKIFHLMTRTAILTLQSVDFRNDDFLAFTISLFL